MNELCANFVIEHHWCLPPPLPQKHSANALLSKLRGKLYFTKSYTEYRAVNNNYGKNFKNIFKTIQILADQGQFSFTNIYWAPVSAK